MARTAKRIISGLKSTNILELSGEIELLSFDEIGVPLRELDCQLPDLTSCVAARLVLKVSAREKKILREHEARSPRVKK